MHKRTLPRKPEEIVELCLAAGWAVDRRKTGTFVYPKSGGNQILIPHRMGNGHGVGNIHARLRRAGIDSDLDALKVRVLSGQSVPVSKPPVPRPPANGPLKPILPPEPAVSPESEPAAVDEPAPAAKPEPAAGPPYPDMYTDTVLVTPEMAEEWLSRELPMLPARNGKPARRLKQRRTSDEDVLTWARVMENGDWEQSPQGISLATTAHGNTGGVLDGKPRLRAVTVIGIPQWFRVTYEVPPHLFHIFDIGRKRTSGVVLGIAGHEYSNDLSSLAKLFIIWEMWQENPNDERLRDWTLWSRVSISTQEVHDVVEDRPDLAEHLAAVKKLVGPPVRLHVPATALLRVWLADVWPEAIASPEGSTEDLSTFAKWATMLRDGHGDSYTKEMSQLRDWIKEGRARKLFHGSAREAYLVAMVKTWNQRFAPIKEGVDAKESKMLRVAGSDRLPQLYGRPSRRCN